MNRCLALLGMSLFGLFAWFSAADETAATRKNELLSQDEQVLKQAGINLETAGLLDYFRRRTPDEKEQARLKQLAGQLGSNAYPVRARATTELIHAGRAALPGLRLTLKSNDSETVRRAQHCVKIIEQNTRPGLSATASRVLADRKASEAVTVLLAYLPLVEDSWIEEEIRQSIQRLGLERGRASQPLEAALTDKEAKRRGAAAWIVGQSSDPVQRRQVLPLLQDEAAQVRFLAAAALLPAREPAAVPALIRLLADGPPDLGWRAEELLFRLAGESGPTVWLDAASDNQGNKVRTAWESWWKNNAAKIDWHKLQLGEQALGLTLVVENQRDGGGRIYECTPAGTIRWQVPILNPIDAQWLPGGRLLVGDSRASLIYEMDTRGAITWKHAGIAPTSCQRLPNGNTVVSTYQCILELTREGKTIFTHSTQGHTYHARKLPDGHYIWIDACGEVGMIDDRGKEIAKIKIGNGLTWGSVERLPNGRFLIALGGVNRIQEIDLAGKVYWEKAINNPNRAARLANGNILVASHGDQCIYELDPHGKQLWKHDCAGRPFAAARR